MELVFYNVNTEEIFIYEPDIKFSASFHRNGTMKKIKLSTALDMKNKNLYFLGHLSPTYKEEV